MAQGTVDISSAELLVERVARLKAAVGRLCHLPAAAEMTVRLDRALQYLQAETVPAVVQAVLLGPTGAGNRLFNSYPSAHSKTAGSPSCAPKLSRALTA